MALACVAFGGFEMGDSNEAYSKSGVVQSDFTTAFTPAHGTERWVMKLAENSPAKTFQTDYFAQSDFSIFGGIFQFNSLAPNGAVYFMSGVTAGTDYDIRVRLNTDGTLSIINANGNVVQTTLGTPLTVDTWHRIELYWERVNSNGTAELYIDGTLRTSTNSGDFLNDAGDSDVALELSGQAGVASVSCRTLVNSFYYLTGATAASERLGDYEVIGPYQTCHDTAVADAKVGGGAPDDLDLGTWLGMSDLPPQPIPYGKYNNTHQGLKTTDGTKRAGPKYDGRVIQDNIVAASWVYKANRASAVAQYGAYDTSGSTYNVAEGAAIPDNGNLSIVVDAGSSYVPDYDDYFMLGFRSDNARGSIVEDAWAHLLQTVTEGERVRLHVEGAAIKGAVLCP